MKNLGKICYIAVCLMICLFPFAGMAAAPDNQTTENRKLAAFPDFKKEGEWNAGFLQELGSYFEDHFAFRTALVTLDANIQGSIFQVSNVDTVTFGKNGWLYYTAANDDFLRRNTMSERAAFNAAHNIALIQRYVQDKGAEFVLAAAPNKNSVYGENMPYYLQYRAGTKSSMDLLEQELRSCGVSFVDLFSLFKEQDELLYLKRDSHWNQKGAVLAYDAILDQAGVEHDNYETVKALRLKEEYGDLNRMLYPAAGEPEWNYYYEKEHAYTYVSGTESVEEAWIETENQNGRDVLLMFRDSFGNTLLPLMADTFEKGYFSRSQPFRITEYMDACRPDVVVLEKAERNIKEFAQMPPLMEGLPVTLEQTAETVESGTTLEVKECASDTGFWEISGILDSALCGEDVKIYIRVEDEEGQKTYEAFSVSTEETDYGWCVFLAKDKIFSSRINIEVLAESGGKLKSAERMQAELAAVQ